MNTSNLPSDPWIVFDYEVDMFRNLCHLLATDNSEYESLSHTVKNAVVESAVLHARILAAILLSEIREQDDIGLSSLLPGFDCPEIAELRRDYGKRGTRCHLAQLLTRCWHMPPLSEEIVSTIPSP